MKGPESGVRLGCLVLDKQRDDPVRPESRCDDILLRYVAFSSWPVFPYLQLSNILRKYLRMSLS